MRSLINTFDLINYSLELFKPQPNMNENLTSNRLHSELEV